jgi:hypothetical protein
MIDLLVGRRSWELLSDHAAEGQERVLSMSFGECLPELGERDAPR